jgi:hypothetical protein
MQSKRHCIEIRDDYHSNFSTLPVDLLRNLSDFVPPTDLDQFRLTSRRHQKILNGRHKHYKVHYRTISKITKAISNPMEGNEEHMTVTIGNRDFNTTLAKKFKRLCGAQSLRNLHVTMYPGYYHPRSYDPYGPERCTDGAILVENIKHISEHATHLQTLSLVFPSGRVTRQHVDAINASGLRAIAGLNVLMYLRDLRLDLYGANIGDAGVQALSALRTSPALEILELNLCANQIEVQGAEAIATLNETPSLRRLLLHLGFNRLGDAGTIALALLGKACALETLEIDLRGNGIGDPGVGALAELREIPSLRLDLCENSFGANGVEALAGIFDDGSVVRLHLNLRQNSIHTSGINALARKLKTASTLDWLCLDLAFTNVGEIPGVVPLIEAPALSVLYLLLEGNQIDDAGLQVLTELKIVPSIHLSLAYNDVTDAGVDVLGALAQRAQTSLLHLNLTHNDIHDDGIHALDAFVPCSHYVNLSQNPMSPYLRNLFDSFTDDSHRYTGINTWSEEKWNKLCENHTHTRLKRNLSIYMG